MNRLFAVGVTILTAVPPLLMISLAIDNHTILKIGAFFVFIGGFFMAISLSIMAWRI